MKDKALVLFVVLQCRHKGNVHYARFVKCHIAELKETFCLNKLFVRTLIYLLHNDDSVVQLLSL